MALPFQSTLRWANEADFDALADVMFAAVREGESPYTEAQRQAWVPEPRRGSERRTRLLSQDIIVAEADGRLPGFMSLAEGGRFNRSATMWLRFSERPSNMQP